MLTTAGAVALVFPPVFALIGLALLAALPAERREAMDRMVADYSRPLTGMSILAGLAALLVGLLAHATVATESAIYVCAGLVMVGYIAGTGWIVWRNTATASEVRAP